MRAGRSTFPVLRGEPEEVRVVRLRSTVPLLLIVALALSITPALAAPAPVWPTPEKWDGKATWHRTRYGGQLGGVAQYG